MENLHSSHQSPLRILVLTKKNSTSASNVAEEMCTWLKNLGHEVFTPNNLTNAHELKQLGLDLAIVLGGDGTMLALARIFVEQPIPLVGINFGRVGFLTNIESGDWQKALPDVLSGKYTIAKRLALGWRVYRNDAVVYSGNAVNDVVINRGALSRVISLDVRVDSELISRLRADGIIISSPVGSTGYAVSAGGPLVHPANNSIVVTAICPYLSNFPAMVLPHTMPVRITLNQSSTETFVTIDGQESHPLETSDVIEIFSMPEAVHFIQLSDERYFTPLRERGFIHGLQ